MKHLPFCLSLCALLACLSPIPEARNTSGPIEVTLTQGTNLAAALAPNGQELAIDLQGRIWLLPITGGVARPLTDPLGDARQPAWSPDGQQIAFQAYWSGNYHIWTVHRDGSGLQQLTNGIYDHRAPHWSPDGTQIAFASDEGGNYNIWSLRLDSGRLEQLTDDEGNEFDPAWSPDGTRIAYASDEEGKKGVWIYDRSARQAHRLAGSEGNVNVPSWSPDGRQIAFYDYVPRQKNDLILCPVDGTGAPQTLTAESEDLFPFRASWVSPVELIYTADGQILRRKPGEGKAESIPFEATVQLERHRYARRKRNYDAGGPYPVKGIAWPELAPDGEKMAFVALGDLWVKENGSQARRLTTDPFVEIEPAWSSDGTQLAYLGDAGGTPTIFVQRVASGDRRAITWDGLSLGSDGGGLAWSPDGTKIALTQNRGRGSAQLWLLDVTSGEVTSLRSNLPSSTGPPTWLPDGRTVALSLLQPYSTRFREGINQVHFFSIHDERTWKQEGLSGISVGTRAADGPVWSPDGQWMAYVSSGLLWVAPVNPQGHVVGPPVLLSTELADMPSWAGDSKSLLYLATDRLKRLYIEDGTTVDVPLDLDWSRRPPEGRTVIQLGGLFDGQQTAIRKNVDVIIDGHRIVAIEDHDPDRRADRIIDARNAYGMPGLIEMHSHHGTRSGEQLRRAWLAWGVTTVRCPGGDPYDALNQREATEAGIWAGPRTYFSGRIIDGNRFYHGSQAQQSLAQVKLELQRAQQLEYDLIKTYVRLPDARQRKIVEYAHDIGIPVTSHELYPAVGYGTDGVEHMSGTSRRGYSPKISFGLRSYDDIISLLSASGMSLTPTAALITGYSYLLAQDPTVLDDVRLRTFPFNRRNAEQRISQVRSDQATWDYRFQNLTSTLKTMVDAGGTIVAGTDAPGVPYGFSLHLELETYTAGGLTPFQALQTATINAARALGAEEDLGSIEPGKLADLLIVEADPLADIRNVRQIRTVVANGEVFTLEQLLTIPE